MELYNLMTCQGPTWSLKDILGGCSVAWIGVVITLFLAAVLRKQTDDGVLSGTGYNAIGAFALGVGLNILVVSLTGEARWGLLAGLVGIAAGGFGLGLITGGTGESY